MADRVKFVFSDVPEAEELERLTDIAKFSSHQLSFLSERGQHPRLTACLF